MDVVPKEDLEGFARDLRAAARKLAPTLRAADKAPLVLTYTPTWRAAEERASDLAAIRAELRGLGAGLVILSPSGVWSFYPDDDIERLSAREMSTELRSLACRRGLELECSPRPSLALFVFVFDGEGNVRFAEVVEGQGASVGSTLRAGLSGAGRRMSALKYPTLQVSRREWMLGHLIAALGVALGCNRRPSDAPHPDAGRPAEGARHEDALDLVLEVNGVERHVRVEPRVTLLDALRERMELTGTKKGCDHGQCGACTVLVDDRRVCSCLLLALSAHGSKIVTIEGLADGATLHPVQQAFVALDGLQCGYCTPGQIMSAVGLLREGHARTDDEVREQMSGNICRCGAYPNIVAAVQLARKSV